MATTTPNYGWDVPTSTDYVKDGATAIETLGDDIDATLWTALGGAYPGLRLVKKQTIGSGVSSVTVTNAFSATYENYCIRISGGNASADNLALGMQLTGITTGYYGTMVFSTYVGGGFQVVATNNQASMPYFGAANSVSLFAQVEINAPFLNEHKTLQSIFYDNTNAGRGQYNIFSTASATGFTVSPNTGTLTGGTIYVYGYGTS